MKSTVAVPRRVTTQTAHPGLHLTASVLLIYHRCARCEVGLLFSASSAEHLVRVRMACDRSKWRFPEHLRLTIIDVAG